MSYPSLDELAQGARRLHCFSETAVKAMEIIDSGENDIAGISRIIAQDQCLAARVLQIANSPFYGLSREISSIKEACVMIGLHTLRGIVVAAGIAGCMAETKKRREEQHSLWKHAVGTAAISYVLADYSGEDKEAAFTVGLLHDIGRTIISLCAPKAASAILDYQEAHRCSVNEAEESVLGFDHRRVGEIVAEQWRLPPKIVIAISRHHDPLRGEPSALAGIAYLANQLYWSIESGDDAATILKSLDAEVMKSVGMDAGIVGMLFPQIGESCHQAYASLGTLK